MTINYTTHYRLAKPDFNTEPWHAAVLSFLDAVDNLIFQIQNNNNTANWANATAMSVGMIRIDTSDGSQWLCRVSHTSAAGPTTFATDRSNNPTFWIVFEASYNIRGAWANSTVYAFNDLVYDASVGIIAACITPHTSHAPVANITADATNWKYLCQFTPTGNASTIAFTNTNTDIASSNVQSALAELSYHNFVNWRNTSVTFANSLRWKLELTGVESGANSGSNLVLHCYDDTGALITNPFQFNRATGNVSVFGAWTFSSRITITGDGTLGNLAFLNTVGSATIDAGSVGTSQLADGGVTTPKLVDGSIIARKLNSSIPGLGSVMINGRINVSVTGNALTIAVKTLANNADPSTADPVYVVFQDATPTNGFPVVRSLIAATSLVISAGSTMGFISGVPGGIWWGFIDNSGTPELYAINCLTGINIYPLKQFPLISTSAEGGVGGADSSGVAYSASARSSKAYNVGGKLIWETALGTAGNWSAAPDHIRLNTGSLPMPGSVIQTQQNITGTFAAGATTAIPFDNTIPQSSEGTQFMTQAITPTSGTNLLDIEIDGQLAGNASSADNLSMALFQDAIANALSACAGYDPITSNAFRLSLHHIMQALITTSTTFKMRAGNGGATAIGFNGINNAAQVFGGVANSRMSVKEIMT